jgi:hypothetical protein
MSVSLSRNAVSIMNLRNLEWPVLGYDDVVVNYL